MTALLKRQFMLSIFNNFLNKEIFVVIFQRYLIKTYYFIYLFFTLEIY